MGKASYVNVGGVWKKAKNVWRNVGGVWKEGVMTWRNVGGVWKECMEYASINPSANSITLDWPYRSESSITVNVSPDTMSTTTIITSGTFFTILVGSSATGDFTITLRATVENDSTPNSGSIQITDNSSNANPVTINVSQLSKPI